MKGKESSDWVMATALQQFLQLVPGERLTYQGTVKLRLDPRGIDGSGACVTVTGGSVRQLIEKIWYKDLLCPHSRLCYTRISI